MIDIIQKEDVLVDDKNILARMINMDHEQVLFCQDKVTGLKAIIAIHSTVLGPSLGGTRMWDYSTEQEALTDVLRLSKGMTYKNSISGLNLGGGKAVIIGNSHTQKNEALFRRFGQFVESLSGKYITAEDVGISPQDITWVHKETNYVAGLPGKSGDPSPVTAYGVYMGMKACAKVQLGSDSLANVKIAVQGTGHVGQYLIKHLTDEGAKVFVTDIYEPSLKEVSDKYGVRVVGLEEIYDLDVDIYAPCALGATINNGTLNRLKCSIIAGAANNQLQNEKLHGQAVTDRGIIYAPDFMVNAGGVINCFAEVDGRTSDWAMEKAAQIYDTTTQIIKASIDYNTPTYVIANKMAEDRIREAK